MRSLLIVNPTAGQFHAELLGLNFSRSRFSRTTEEVTPQSARETAEIAAKVATSGSHEVIYVSGGDGTINTVASSILRATPDATAAERPAIGIVPAGTCNVLAGELGINEFNIAGIIRRRSRRMVRTLDIGRVGDNYFLLMAGYGIDGEAVRNVNLDAKNIFGASAYAISALSTLASHKPSLARLTIDSRVIKVETSLVLIANAQSYGLNMIKIAPEASLDDGWLDVCVFEPAALAPANLLTTVARAVSPKPLSQPDVQYFRARSVKIEADPPMPGQLDGDASGRTPVEVELLPAALNFLVPKQPR